jgi:hypothetical protein
MGLEIFFPIGALLLLVALVGVVLYLRGRNRANDRVTEKATHELYKDPEHYPEKREELKKEIRPP